MSRETDSPSAGPQGGGGAAYPSGTPPYGSGQYPSTDPAATASEENSVTSNPSTPDTDGPKTETTLTTRIRINIPGSRPIPPVVVRKPVAEAEAEAEAAAAPADRPGAEPEPPRAPAPPAPEPAAEPEASANNWFAPRKPPQAPAASTAAPAAPALPKRTPAAEGSAPALPARTPAAAEPLPVRTPAPPVRGGATGGGFAPPAAPAAGGAPQGFAPAPQPPAPAGPGFAGPPLPPPAGPGAGETQGFPAFPGDGGPATEPFPAFDAPEGPGRSAGPAGPTGGPALGSFPVDGPRADAAPQWPGPDTGAAARTPVPPPGPAAPSGPAGAAAPRAPKPSADRPAAPRPAKAAAPKPTKVAKARSKLVLLGGGVVSLLAVAYGAGLLLNHSDVPKGTTVLGVDISGSRDEAVAKLQTAFGNRAATPLQLTVGGKPVELKPEKAGLSLDAQTTVRNAAGSDYNPVTVIGSLLGNERVADPVMPVDEEKLQVALQELAGTAGTVTEGTIKFDTGKAVAVPGKAGTTLDTGASAELVTKAFRDMVATGSADAVELPVTTKEPAVNQAELDRAMKEFAEPAMSGIATVKAGPKSIPFGPKSLPKILSMQAVDGKLVEKYDLEALKAIYGNSFDGVLITRGTGEKTPVSPQDVAGALGKALRGKTTAERTVTIDTNPN
ncbi:hypothetical protein [Streptomyces sp. enrichment culture]|uniref:hypothetical protein n=1 Tax=Streptomyces sp. enrichment culture TaxID=1795815 RepID=UPI003F5449B8